MALYWAGACLESSACAPTTAGQVRTMERGMDVLRLALTLGQECPSE